MRLLITRHIKSSAEGTIKIVMRIESLGASGIKAKRTINWEVNRRMVGVKNYPFFFYEIILALRIYSLNNSGG